MADNFAKHKEVTSVNRIILFDTIFIIFNRVQVYREIHNIMATSSYLRDHSYRHLGIVFIQDLEWGHE